MKRLLVIKPSSLGDIVHGLQLMQVVAQAKPELRISWVVRERFAGLVQAAPFVAETLIFRRGSGWRGFWPLLREIRARRFDAVWDLQGLLRSGVMTAAARAPEKWGRRDAREGARFFYNRRIRAPEGDGPHHALEILLRFAESVGVRPEVSFPLMLKDGEAFAWQKFFSGEPRRHFVIFTDSRGPEKNWGRFPELMKRIWETVPESRIAWCAGTQATLPFEAPPGRFLNLTGCPLAEMIALVRQPSVFIGNDSGPMHLSAATGNRVLAIFGPTSPRRFGPFPLESPRHLAIEAPEGRLADLEPSVVLAGLAGLCGRS